DMHISKLEDDVKSLREDNKQLRRKLRKLEERNYLQEENTSTRQTSVGPSTVGESSSASSVPKEATYEEIKKGSTLKE
ncbi:hypothetical protein ACJMK2_007022, partial [Sinanodonta woodiana]